jgi:protein gp37
MARASAALIARSAGTGARRPQGVCELDERPIGHARVAGSFVARTWAVMALALRHTFQVLTKRPRRLAVMLADQGFVRQVGEAATEIVGCTPHGVWRMI